MFGRRMTVTTQHWMCVTYFFKNQGLLVGEVVSCTPKTTTHQSNCQSTFCRVWMDIGWDYQCYRQEVAPKPWHTISKAVKWCKEYIEERMFPRVEICPYLLWWGCSIWYNVRQTDVTDSTFCIHTWIWKIGFVTTTWLSTFHDSDGCTATHAPLEACHNL